MKYDKIKEGEWVTPVEDKYRLACSNCGTVHNLDFRVFFNIEDGTKDIQFRVFKNNRATGQVKRHMRGRN